MVTENEGDGRVGGRVVRGQEWPLYELKLSIPLGGATMQPRVTLQEIGYQWNQSKEEGRRRRGKRSGRGDLSLCHHCQDYTWWLNRAVINLCSHVPCCSKVSLSSPQVSYGEWFLNMSIGNSFRKMLGGIDMRSKQNTLVMIPQIKNSAVLWRSRKWGVSRSRGRRAMLSPISKLPPCLYL